MVRCRSASCRDGAGYGEEFLSSVCHDGGWMMLLVERRDDVDHGCAYMEGGGCT